MGSGSDRLTLCVSVHKGVSRSVLRDPRRGAGELDHQPVALGWCCAIPSRGFPLLPTVTSSLDGGLLGPNCPLGSPGEKNPSPGLEGNSDLPPSCLRGGPHERHRAPKGTVAPGVRYRAGFRDGSHKGRLPGLWPRPGPHTHHLLPPASQPPLSQPNARLSETGRGRDAE